MPRNKFSIQVNKTDEKRLINKMKSLDSFGRKEVDIIIESAAQGAVAKMKKAVPVDTGRLKRQIEVDRLGKGRFEIDSSAVDPQSGRQYSTVIEEYGGRFKRGLHYFREGTSFFRGEARAELRNRLGTIVKQKNPVPLRAKGKI